MIPTTAFADDPVEASVFPMHGERVGLEHLTDLAFRGYLETGDWSSACRSPALAERALVCAGDRWLAVRAVIGQALACIDDADRPVALAEVALAEFEKLQDWFLVRRILERFRIGAEGCGRRSVALDGVQVGQALSLAQSWQSQTPRKRT